MPLLSVVPVILILFSEQGMQLKTSPLPFYVSKHVAIDSGLVFVVYILLASYYVHYFLLLAINGAHNVIQFIPSELFVYLVVLFFQAPVSYTHY